MSTLKDRQKILLVFHTFIRDSAENEISWMKFLTKSKSWRIRIRFLEKL